jgi:hypothetical protein
MRKHIDNIGGRKFILSAASGFAATLLQWFGKLDPVGSTYMWLMGACVAAYITGDVFETKVLGRKANQPTESAP